MADGSDSPEENATRFAADGTLEEYDGKAWVPYRGSDDDGFGFAFKGSPQPKPADDHAEPADDHANGEQ
jgi:hypothetical protein